MTNGILALDYGGTLAGPSPRVTAAGLLALARAKYGDLPEDAEAAWTGALAEERRWERETGRQRPLSVIASSLLRGYGIEDDGVALVDALFDSIGDGAPLPAALPVLRWAHEAGFGCVLASNTYRTLRAREHTLAAGGLRPYFRDIVLSSETGARKPAPEFYSAVVDAAGVPAQRIVFAGDTLEKDVLAPLAAGMSAIFVADRPPAHDITHPRYLGRVPRLDGIMDLLRHWQPDAA
jgi:putative hydrolase of the HAD superfamily